MKLNFQNYSKLINFLKVYIIIELSSMFIAKFRNNDNSMYNLEGLSIV